MRLIVTSQKDIAGTNIYNCLANDFDFKNVGEFEGRPIFKKGNVMLILTRKRQTHAGHLDEFFDPEYYIFASRHKSESGVKTLTVHTPGNLLDEALLGGRARELAWANAHAMKVAMIELKENSEERGIDYRISLEATHHGPSGLKKPVTFVEVGSSEKEWRDKRAVKAVAAAALKGAESKEKFEVAIGIGGPHYAPRHTNIVLKTNIAIGHIIPSYAIDTISEEVFRQAIGRTGASFGILDWKGMKKGQRERILKLADRVDIELKRSKDL